MTKSKCQSSFAQYYIERLSVNIKKRRLYLIELEQTTMKVSKSEFDVNNQIACSMFF